ncbi:hypothetical protein Ocin01_12702 [Orchesella cincta]|uniref:Uncharacterized protein n=1 Tax=Orchesella cincta TaxID=48709 RepID=A0A1D2MLS6_ORCCI|nr:hypothetical protein Ocin01_12702 [Orchesella cincta]
MFDISPASPPSRPEDSDNIFTTPSSCNTKLTKRFATLLPSLISCRHQRISLHTPPSRSESGARQRRSQARKQGSQTRRKRLNFNSGNGDESDASVIGPHLLSKLRRHYRLN